MTKKLYWKDYNMSYLMTYDEPGNYLHPESTLDNQKLHKLDI